MVRVIGDCMAIGIVVEEIGDSVAISIVCMAIADGMAIVICVVNNGALVTSILYEVISISIFLVAI